MKRISIQSYISPAGELILGSLEGKLCLCDWRYRRMRSSIDRRICGLLYAEYRELDPGEHSEEDDDTISRAREELEQYFRGERREFTIPLLTAGTPFQKEVWEELCRVRWGETVSYSELARRVGRPDAVRAVAAANGANALSLFIPCHRIIGSNGDLVGYAGGMRAKSLLLDLEQERPVQFDLFSEKAGAD